MCVKQCARPGWQPSSIRPHPPRQVSNQSRSAALVSQLGRLQVGLHRAAEGLKKGLMAASSPNTTHTVVGREPRPMSHLAVGLDADMRCP
eukprot:5755129-Pyramimonas_sp.AAC.1